MSDKLEETISSQLTLLQWDFHAKMCQFPDDGQALLESGVDYGSSLRGLLMNLNRAGLLSRTSPAFYPAVEGQTLPSSFAGWQSGGMAWRGGCLTLSTLDWQRRRRVFIVASLGNGCAAQVLFEREGGNWHTAPSREEGQEVAYSITHGPSSGYRYSPEDNMIPDIALPLANSRTTDHQDESQQTYIAFNNRQDPITSEVAQPLGAKDNGNGISFTLRPRSGNVPFVGIRRLTPTECERLQGFPDGWTTGQADSTRYRQLGNAVAVPCAEWIGKYMMETNNKKGELK